MMAEMGALPMIGVHSGARSAAGQTATSLLTVLRKSWPSDAASLVGLDLSEELSDVADLCGVTAAMLAHQQVKPNSQSFSQPGLFDFVRRNHAAHFFTVLHRRSL
jgi:hypothetical protein